MSTGKQFLGQGTMNEGSRNFPPVDIADGKKDEAWHKQFALAAIHNCNYSQRRSAHMTRNYRMFQNTHDDTPVRKIFQNEQGQGLPYNSIRSNETYVMVNRLVGELGQQVHTFEAFAINKDAYNKRLQKKSELFAQQRLRPFMLKQEKKTGLTLAPRTISPAPGVAGQPFPDDPIDLEAMFPKFDIEYFGANTYKDVSELAITRIVNAVKDDNKWDQLRQTLFADLIIAGQAIAKNEFVDGRLRIRRVDPRDFFFSRDTADDHLDRATYVGEITYIPAIEAMTNYDVTPEQIETWRHDRTGYMHIGSFGGARLRRVKQQGDDLEVLMTRVEWMDTKNYTFKESEDKHGNTHFKPFEEERLSKKDRQRQDQEFKLGNGQTIVRKKVQIVRYAVIIGDTVVEHGELQNMPRQIDDPAYTRYTYSAFVPYLIDGENTSLVDLIEPIQTLEDLLQAKYYHLMATSGRKGLAYNVGNLPKDTEIHDVMQELMNTGFVPYAIDFESAANPQLQSRMFTPIDTTNLEHAGTLIQLINWCKTEKQRLTGINDSAMGQQAASQAVGVTQSQISQTSMQSYRLFDGFRKFGELVMTKGANMLKVMDKEDLYRKYGMQLGDVTYAFMQDNLDLAIEDFLVVSQMTNAIIANAQQFQQSLQMALQANAIDIADYLELMQARDPRHGVRKLLHRIEKEKRRQEKMQQQQQMLQAQQRMMQQAMQNEGQNQRAAIDAQGRIGEAAVKGESQQGQQILRNRGTIDRDVIAAMQNPQGQQVGGMPPEMQALLP